MAASRAAAGLVARAMGGRSKQKAGSRKQEAEAGSGKREAGRGLGGGGWGVVGAGLVEEVDGSAEVGDDDGAADDEGDVEGLPDLSIGAAGLDALVDVVGDAVVAAENHGGAQAEEFLGLLVQAGRRVRAGVAVGLVIEGEEPPGDEGSAALLLRAEDLVVEAGAEGLVVGVSGHEERVVRERSCPRPGAKLARTTTHEVY